MMCFTCSAVYINVQLFISGSSLQLLVSSVLCLLKAQVDSIAHEICRKRSITGS